MSLPAAFYTRETVTPRQPPAALPAGGYVRRAYFEQTTGSTAGDVGEWDTNPLAIGWLKMTNFVPDAEFPECIVNPEDSAFIVVPSSHVIALSIQFVMETFTAPGAGSVVLWQLDGFGIPGPSDVQVENWNGPYDFGGGPLWTVRHIHTYVYVPTPSIGITVGHHNASGVSVLASIGVFDLGPVPG